MAPPQTQARTAAPGSAKTVAHKDGSILYLPIALNAGEAAPLTAVFFPTNYNSGSTINFLVYLHGNHADDRGPFTPAMTIEDYLGYSYFSPLLSAVAAKKAALELVFVAPSLGSKAEAGDILTRGLDWYLGEVLNGCVSDGPFKGKAKPTVKNLILACHSGGGRGMFALATQITSAPPGGTVQGVGAVLRECWGFDCLYDAFDVVDAETSGLGALNSEGCETKWKNWANRTHLPLYMHWYERKTRARNLEKLAKSTPQANSVSVIPAFYESMTDLSNSPKLKKPQPTEPPAHNDVPKRYITSRLDNVQFP
jgi:hypothetical protein